MVISDITIIIISAIIAPTINISSFNSPLPHGRCPLSTVQFILPAQSQLLRIILVMIMIMMMMTMTLADDAHRSHIKLMTM